MVIYGFNKGEAVIFPNILSNFFGYESGSSATLLVNQAPVEPLRKLLVFMRTYSEGQNSLGGTGTYGQAVRVVNWKDSLRNDLEGRIIGVTHNNNFRANLILQNTRSVGYAWADIAQDAVVDVYAKDGRLLGSKTYNLVPGEYRQINRFVEDILGRNATVEDATVVIKAPGVDRVHTGGVIAAASVVNNGTNDSRLIIAQPIDRSDPVADAVRAYLNRWFPTNDARFFLSDVESRALINGEIGIRSIRSYVLDLATELDKDPVMQGAFGSVEEVAQWFRDRADGVPTNSEFCPHFDPIQWDNDPIGKPTFRVYDGLGCGPVDFRPGSEAMLRVYDIVRNDFMFKFVRKHPELYGGSPGGVPDISFYPTWNR